MKKFLTTILFLTAAILIVGFSTANAASNTVLDFDGNDYLIASDNAVFDQADRFSISVWAKPDAATDDYILYRSGAYYLKLTSSSTIEGAIYYSSAFHTVISSAITVDGSKWTHIEMTYDKDDGKLKIFLNGKLDKSADYSTSVATPETDLYIGADSTPANYFNGKIDDVRLYQYARSASDVRLDYNEGLATKLGGLTSHSSGGQTSTLCDRDPASCMDYGLVGHWNMDEAGGDTLYDQSDNGNDGTLGSGAGADTSDPKWTSGGGSPTSNSSGSLTSSGALAFDGKNDYVNCGSDSSLNITDAITIEAWVKKGASNSVLLNKMAATPNYSWYIQLTATDKILAYMSQDGTGTTKERFTTTASITSEWQYITVLYDGSIKVYFDGVNQAGTTLGSISSIHTNTADLEIGRYFNDTSYFNGSIDGVKIYNRALSAEEVRYHYNRGGPVAHWKMDEGEGAKAYDESGNRNHGALTGSTSGTADSGSTTTLVDTALTQAEDYWKDYTLKIVTTTDALAPQGETATITGFAAGTDTLTFAALTAAVAADDTYKLYYGDEDGPTWVAGKHFGSLSFDGTDDYIDCGNDSTLDITSAITISAWVKPNVDISAGTYYVFVGKWQSNIGYQLVWHSGGYLYFYITSGAVVRTFARTLNADTWYHLVVSVASASADGKIYIDGIEDVHTATAQTMTSNTGDLIIGKRQDLTYPFNGSIDDVKIYNYARTTEQILVDYNNGLGTHIK